LNDEAQAEEEGQAEVSLLLSPRWEKTRGRKGDEPNHGGVQTGIREFVCSWLVQLSFFISSIAPVGHLVTHNPHPKQRLGSNLNEPSTVSLAPNWHLSTQMPQESHFPKSVFEVVSDVNIYRDNPKRRLADNTPQQQEQQLQIAFTLSSFRA